MRLDMLKRLMAAIVPLLVAMMAVAPGTAWSAEADAKVTANKTSLWAGYDFLDVDGGQTLLPYGYLESHPTAGFSLFHYYPAGASIRFNGQYNGDAFYDVFIEGNHRGQVDLTLGSTRFPKNSTHYSLPVSDTGLGSYESIELSPGDEYRLDVGRDEAGMRWRIPMYPAHVILGVSRFSMKGDIQQRFLNQSCGAKCHTYSQTREIDSKTDTAKVGLDAHLGVMDAAYSFKALDYQDDAATPTWVYGTQTRTRTAGEYEHNANPEMRSREHRLTLSTTHTGRLTAAAGWTLGTRANADADVSQDYGMGMVDFTWRPGRRTSVALRYLRRERDEQADDAAAAALRAKYTAPANFGSVEDRLSATATFRPVTPLRLRLDGIWRKVERQDGEAWELPERTETTDLRASAQLKPTKSLTADFQYRHQMADDPAYAQTPTDSDDGSIKIDWRPVEGLFVQGICTARWGRNDKSVLAAGDGKYEPDWSEERYLYQANVTYALKERATFGLHYNHFDNDVTEDLMIVPDTTRFPTDGTLYNLRIDQVLLTASWKPSDPLELSFETSLTDAAGDYSLEDEVFGDIDDYATLETTQWGLALEGTYRWAKGWSVEGRTSWTDLDDRSLEDADESIAAVSVTVGKTW